MNIYTKNGDRGITSLTQTKNISKSDDRIELVGAIDELTSHLGLIKTMSIPAGALRMLEDIQHTLIRLMAGVSDPYNKEYRIEAKKTQALEAEIDRLEGLFDRPKEFVLPGNNRISAEIDIARSVARRAERALASVSVKFGADNESKKFMNRLGDYLYVLARYADAGDIGKAFQPGALPEKNAEQALYPASAVAHTESSKENHSMDAVAQSAVREILQDMGIQSKITLDQAKKLIEMVEEEAKRRGKKAVIAVCGPDGNPIAVHVMDGAFLVSFDVAVKKAYTSVAVKMSTMELNALAQPGGTFYGLDKMEGGNIIIFGGGVPIVEGGTIIGGLGVSGGTGEEDHSLAEYGLAAFAQMKRG